MEGKLDPRQKKTTRDLSELKSRLGLAKPGAPAPAPGAAAPTDTPAMPGTSPGVPAVKPGSGTFPTVLGCLDGKPASLAAHDAKGGAVPAAGCNSSSGGRTSTRNAALCAAPTSTA
jgi:hypothetical protein